jgi:hypothetical protein
MTGPTVLVLPGYQSSGPEHWQSLWEAAHPERFGRVQQRDWEYPDRDEWVAALAQAVKGTSGPVVLVAHSLGCLTVAHWAREGGETVVGALLVAPPDIERPDALRDVRSFRPIPRDPLPFPSIVVASSDDLHCDPERARHFAQAWGSRLVELESAGHINTAAGFGPWPEGEALLAELKGG